MDVWSAFQKHLKQINSIPVLTPKEEMETYDQLAKGGESADGSRQRLYESHLRLVVYVAKQYVGFGFTLMSLIDAGNEALKNAVEQFTPEQGKFETYATFWIRRTYTRMIARSMVQTIEEFKIAVGTAHDELGQTPTNGQLAKLLGVPIDDLFARIICVLEVLPNSPMYEDTIKEQDLFPYDLLSQTYSTWQNWRDDNEQIWWRD